MKKRYSKEFKETLIAFDVKSSFQSNKRMDYYHIIRHKKEKH